MSNNKECSKEKIKQTTKNVSKQIVARKTITNQKKKKKLNYKETQINLI